MTLWIAAHDPEILSLSHNFIHIMSVAKYLGMVLVPSLRLLFTLEFSSPETSGHVLTAVDESPTLFGVDLAIRKLLGPATEPVGKSANVIFGHCSQLEKRVSCWAARFPGGDPLLRDNNAQQGNRLLRKVPYRRKMPGRSESP